MNVNPYLHFSGNCRDAINFYASALGAKINMVMTYGEAPEGGTPALGHLIMHASLTFGDTQLMCSDAPPDRQQQPAGFTISLNVTDPAEAERLFAAVSEGGAIHMPMQKTFWAQRFGMATDKFGMPWMVNCE